MCGCTVFSVLGYIANLQGRDIEDVVSSGPGLVFMVCLKILTRFEFSCVDSFSGFT